MLRAGCHAAAACGLRSVELLARLPRGQALLHRLRHRPRDWRRPHVHGERLTACLTCGRTLRLLRPPRSIAASGPSLPTAPRTSPATPALPLIPSRAPTTRAR
eukprot:3941289-Rhodomonas_salina.2